MSRYLTPSKIGLLALVSLYTESVVPSAAIVPILSFLISHLLPVPLNAPHPISEPHPQNSALSIDDFQRATINHISGIPGRTVWDLLLQKVWKIDSFDALHVFFDTLSLLLQKTPEERQKETEDGVDPAPNRLLLSRVSPLGTFVRRAQLEFTRLPFHDGITLWKAFVTYRASTLLQWKKRNPTAGITSFDSNLGNDNLSWEDPLTDLIYGELESEPFRQASRSTEDIEKLLDYQVDHMQRGCSTSTLSTLKMLRSVLRDGKPTSTSNESSNSWHARIRNFGPQLVPLRSVCITLFVLHRSLTSIKLSRCMEIWRLSILL